MVKLNKIYTRTGDDGSTGLADGSRVSKTSRRVAAYGSCDEANAVIGLARLSTQGDTDAMLARIQNELFDVGADLATPEGPEWALRATATQVERLEQEIDAMNAHLEALNSFILPGGTPASAWLHLARTVVRRAEREAVAAAETEAISTLAISYLNRLSDHLFVLSRAENNGHGDVLWVPGRSR